MKNIFISLKSFIMKNLFFSVVIPAHNEAGYIEKTIEKLKSVDYPESLFEAIIVENGSTDNTNEIISRYASSRFKIISVNKNNVSIARNEGLKKVREDCDWVIFLDADTYFEKDFLKELNNYLLCNSHKNLGNGMVSLLPDPNTRYARGWYHFYNLANHITKSTRSIQIIRRDLLIKIKYDEALTFDEDTKLIKQCQQTTKFFFLGTKNVFSSTRRFVKKGWFRQLFIWIYFHFQSEERKKKISYEVTR